MEATKFVMLLMSDHKMTQLDIQSVLKGTSDFINSIVVQKLEEAATILRENGCVHTEMVEGVKNNFSETELFHDIRTQKSQFYYINMHMGMVMPRKVELPQKQLNFGRGRTGYHQEKYIENYVIVSLLDQLRQLLNIPEVYASITKDKLSMADVWSHFEDGNLFSKSEFFYRHPKALQIHIYIDGIQMCNPCGSYMHKLATRVVAS